MHAMVLTAQGAPLLLEGRPKPAPGTGEIRVRIEACAVCRTDLHVIDGELPHIRHPIVPGHEIVGIVEALGPAAGAWEIGQRVGIP
ncbi:MAG: alcohol dehydrogenase catalytic domain-containing protein, partial [Steroidobacteraceae bacterium]